MMDFMINLLSGLLYCVGEGSVEFTIGLSTLQTTRLSQLYSLHIMMVL